MANTKFTPLAAGLDTSPAHPDADLIALAQLGDQAEADWAATPEDSDVLADLGSSAHGRDVLASILDDLERRDSAGARLWLCRNLAPAAPGQVMGGERPRGARPV